MTTIEAMKLVDAVQGTSLATLWHVSYVIKAVNQFRRASCR
jgi:hypothetical protein